MQKPPDESTGTIVGGMPLTEWWGMPENERVVAVLKAVGVDVLGGFDGCACCSFKVRNVEIDISCGKGGDRGIWISSPSLDYWDKVTADGNDPDLLRPIAEEVARQVEESDGRGHIPINFHERGRADEE